MRFFLTRGRWRKALLCGIVMSAAVAAPVPADDGRWHVDAERSVIAFEAEQNGAPVPGSFASFTAEIVFDPERLEDARVRVRIATASLRTGDAMRDGVLRAAAWFEVDRFPEAVFEALRFARLSPGRFAADGRLTIRDRENPVRLLFDLRIAGSEARAVGEAVLSRAAFDLGGAEAFRSLGIADEVRVTIDITARER